MIRDEVDVIYEKLLVSRAQGRDAQAFGELVQRYERKILYYLRRVLNSSSDLEDILQDVWLTMYVRLPSIRAPEAFRSLLYKFAHDTCVNRLRKQGRMEYADLETAAGAPAPDEWNEFELLERIELVHKTLDRMTQPHREVLTLRFLEGFDLTEIAQITGVSVGTVKSRLHYAKTSMRTLLEIQEPKNHE